LSDEETEQLPRQQDDRMPAKLDPQFLVPALPTEQIKPLKKRGRPPKNLHSQTPQPLVPARRSARISDAQKLELQAREVRFIFSRKSTSINK
jgi:hypothetical protein